jgi:hypothetical protein
MPQQRKKFVRRLILSNADGPSAHPRASRRLAVARLRPIVSDRAVPRQNGPRSSRRAWGSSALPLLVSLAVAATACVPDPNECPLGGLFTDARGGQFCSYPNGVAHCPDEFPYDYRAGSAAAICGTELLQSAELPRRACWLAGVKNCESFSPASIDAGEPEPDAASPDSAGPLIDAEPKPDAEGDGALDGGIGGDAAPEEDGAAPSDAGDASRVVVYEADFSAGAQGWEATGAWIHGPVFDDVAWSNTTPREAESSLTSPIIDVSGAADDPTLEVEIRYFGEWMGDLPPTDWQLLHTAFRISYNGGAWESIASSRTEEVGIHWGPWACTTGGPYTGATRCEQRWVRAAVPLPRRTAADKVQLQFHAGQMSWTPMRVPFAVRRVRIDLDPRRHHARGAGFTVNGVGQPWDPQRPPTTGAAAVSFPVPPGSTIRQFSLSATVTANEPDNISVRPISRVWVRFPSGYRSELVWYWHQETGTSDYHLVFDTGEPIGSSAEGEFRVEAEGPFVRQSVTVAPWFAELLTD